MKKLPLKLSNLDPIQYQILLSLAKSSNALSFTDLKPDFEIANDRYNYHLQYLLKNDLVIKSASGYSLSSSGKQIIAESNIEGNPENLFRISVILNVTRINQGKLQILMQQRTRQPFFGDISGIAGKVRIGETIEQAAARKLMEETGLSAQFQLLGVYRKIKILQNQVMEDVFYHHCFAHDPAGNLVEQNIHGKNFWTSFAQAKRYCTQNQDQGKYDQKILDLIKKSPAKLFYFQEQTQLKSY